MMEEETLVSGRRSAPITHVSVLSAADGPRTKHARTAVKGWQNAKAAEPQIAQR